MANLDRTKIVSICVSLGEYPTIRYHRPRNPVHEASVLSSHLARFVQDELDQYAKFHEDFPPPSPRPRGSLIITDRSMDLFAPVLHEFTYQAMVHDLLPVKDGDKVFYKTVVNQGDANQEEKDMEIGEKDKIWVENRHLHMKDLLEKLVGDFNKFRAENPQFAERFVVFPQYHVLVLFACTGYRQRLPGALVQQPERQQHQQYQGHASGFATISGGKRSIFFAPEHGPRMHGHLSKVQIG